jgi:hypothetical protein
MRASSPGRTVFPGRPDFRKTVLHAINAHLVESGYSGLAQPGRFVWEARFPAGAAVLGLRRQSLSPAQATRTTHEHREFACSE